MRPLSYLTWSEYTENVLSRGRGTRELRVQLRTWPCNNRELKQRRRWRQRGQQKSNRFSLANSSSARASRFFLYISLPSLHDYDVKIPNFMFYGGREHKTTTFFFFSWTSIQFFRIHLQRKLPTFDKLNAIGHGISAIKFEAARLHFLSDVFVAVTVVVA